MYTKTNWSEKLDCPGTILSSLGNLMILATFSGMHESLVFVQCAVFILHYMQFLATGLVFGITK